MAPDDRISLARTLFALITMELEDAVMLAADGQGAQGEHRMIAERLIGYAETIGVLANAARAVLD